MDVKELRFALLSCEGGGSRGVDWSSDDSSGISFTSDFMANPILPLSVEVEVEVEVEVDEAVPEL